MLNLLINKLSVSKFIKIFITILILILFGYLFFIIFFKYPSSLEQEVFSLLNDNNKLNSNLEDLKRELIDEVDNHKSISNESIIANDNFLIVISYILARVVLRVCSNIPWP